MARIREKINKDGKKKYYVEIRVKGYKPINAVFERKTDATIWAGGIESEMKRGIYIQDSLGKTRTLNCLIEQFFKVELDKRNSDKRKLETHLNWWKNELGDYFLNNITPNILSEAKQKLLTEDSLKISKNPKPRSEATVNRYMASLSIVFTKAVKEWGWMNENPMLKVSKNKESRGRVRFLDDNEVALLLARSKEQSYECYLLLLIALMSGARRGEIMGLCWKDIDFKNRQFHFLDTKNGEDRGVPIASIVYEELKKFNKIRNLKSDYIFTNSEGTGLMYLRKHFENAVNNSGLKDFRFHDLRHTAASYLARNGASLLEIAQVLGHKTIQMVKRYSHLTVQSTSSIIEKMSVDMMGIK